MLECFQKEKRGNPNKEAAPINGSNRKNKTHRHAEIGGGEHICDTLGPIFYKHKSVSFWAYFIVSMFLVFLGCSVATNLLSNLKEFIDVSHLLPSLSLHPSGFIHL